MIWRCASKLRNNIFAVQSKQICESVTLDNIMEGEAIPRDSVKASLKCFARGTFQQLKNFYEGNLD